MAILASKHGPIVDISSLAEAQQALGPQAPDTHTEVLEAVLLERGVRLGQVAAHFIGPQLVCGSVKDTEESRRPVRTGHADTSSVMCLLAHGCTHCVMCPQTYAHAWPYAQGDTSSYRSALRKNVPQVTASAPMTYLLSGTRSARTGRRACKGSRGPCARRPGLCEWQRLRSAATGC